MSTKTKTNPRRRLMAAIFTKASKLGIDTGDDGDLRNVIAVKVAGKRMSKCDNKELFKIVEHLAKLAGETTARKRYPAGKAGLIEELKDVSKVRWGDDWEHALNEFVNHNRKTRTHFKFLDIRTLKGIVKRIIQLNRNL